MMNYAVLLLTIILLKGVAKTQASSHDSHDSGNSDDKQVTLRVYTEPDATIPSTNVTVMVRSFSYLIDVLITGQNQGLLNFSYELERYGAYITVMEGVKTMRNESYWALIDGETGMFLPLGASCYQPSNGEIIDFKFTLLSTPVSSDESHDVGVTENKEVEILIYTTPDATTPHLDISVTVPSWSFLIDVLDAAKSQGLSYHYELQTYGAYITMMENVTATSGENYWAILDAKTGSFLPTGISCYQPQNGDQIEFRLTDIHVPTTAPPGGESTVMDTTTSHGGKKMASLAALILPVSCALHNMIAA